MMYFTCKVHMCYSNDRICFLTYVIEKIPVLTFGNRMGGVYL